MFVPTAACKEVESLIKKQNLVIVVGHPGSGKSAIIQHIALKYKSQGWVVKPVVTVQKIVETFITTHFKSDKTLFVFNDPIGVESFDELSYHVWKYNEERVKACLTCIKLLISCRKYIQYDFRVSGVFKQNSNIVDIESDQLKLNKDEKRQILTKYNSGVILHENELKDILETEVYFPLLCKLFFIDENCRKDCVEFFKEPVMVLRKEISNLKKECPIQYSCLVLLIFFNNALCVSDLQKDESSNQKFMNVLKLCGLCTSPSELFDNLEAITGFYVKKIDNIYQFCHNVVLDVTSYSLGQDYPDYLIKYGDIGFLRRRVKLELNCRKEQEDQLTIYLDDMFISQLAERLFTDILGKDFLDVVLNPCLQNEKIINILRQKISSCPKQIEMLLEEKELVPNNQEFCQAFETCLCSRFDFVCLIQNRISPLCALIVFCHTELSLECFKVRNTCAFQNSSLFSAVCCNGSEKLFEEFHDIDSYIKQKWGNFYPIHIVSLFHNYEILPKLVHGEINVNIKTEFGWTPLTLASGNDTEDKNIKETRDMRRNKTIEVLLSHGAQIDLCQNEGSSPLFLACEKGYDSTVKLLLQNRACINLCKSDKFSPLYIACQEGHVEIVKLLLDAKAKINQLNSENKSSPLFIACQEGREKTVELLLSHGAEVNLCRNDGVSPLYIACKNGHECTVRHLLDKDAQLNLTNKNGASPLFIACQEGHEKTVELLLSHGANVNLCRNDNVSPLYIARKNGHGQIEHLLKKYCQSNASMLR